MRATLVYRSLEWLEVGVEPTEDMAQRNETCPREGEIRWLWNRYSYIAVPVGGRGWLFYRPGLESINDWANNPKELEESALVEVEILKLRDPYWAADEDKKWYSERPHLRRSHNSVHAWKGWAEVVCRRVVPLTQISNSFPIVSTPQLEFDFITKFNFDSQEQYQTPMMNLYINRYPTTTEWWLITHGPPKCLILYCLNVFYEPQTAAHGPIQIWNWLLPPKSGE